MATLLLAGLLLAGPALAHDDAAPVATEWRTHPIEGRLPIIREAPGYVNVTSSKATAPRVEESTRAPSRSATSAGRSRYWKMRWKSASEPIMLTCRLATEPMAPASRLPRIVTTLTTVPTVVLPVRTR